MIREAFTLIAIALFITTLLLWAGLLSAPKHSGTAIVARMERI